MKERDITNAYRAIIWLLVSNNIAGIALNPKHFIWSLFLVVGIPGLGLLLYYFFVAIKNKPPLHFLLHLCAIAYNVIIYFMLSDRDIHQGVIGGAIWPIINICLSIAACGLASIKYIKLANPDENKTKI